MDNNSVILLSALELFSAKGYDAVGIQEIVDAAGVTKPSLYYHFGSKRGLLDAVLKEHMPVLFRSVSKAAEYQRDLPYTLARLAKAYFSYASKHKVFYEMLFSLLFAPPESESCSAVETYVSDQYDLLEGLFTRASYDNGNMKGRQRAYAATFLGMINTYIWLSFKNSARLDDRLLNSAVHQFMHGIFS